MLCSGISLAISILKEKVSAMRYLLRDLFSDVIEAAKEAGTWQTLTLNEKEEVVNYFLRHFDSLIKEARWLRFSRLMTSYAPGGPRQRTRGGIEHEDELLGV
jgi:hypothetical protein